ncbi:YqcI/YcgG family protein [Paenibacillus albicereus]|uniref:YqcI/YcgG family protein n=1 Tax=Paenibacillus albicereus TaxID=2726185 RepID=A0A6H2H1D7_9BACL|nr:YqcI/YcgG family protein [Paenibacillus albicereus]QJC53503.1 YqcI/YcgG family protein [Paenibacillus albicereus]
MTTLYDKRTLDEIGPRLEPWQLAAWRSFGEMVADDADTYPCVPGRQGYLSGQLRYGFAADPRTPQAVRDLASLLEQYGPVSRATGKYASLAVFFHTPPALAGAPVKRFESLFWSLMRRVSLQDRQPWPEGIPRDPHRHDWEFCFGGEPYFAFCATPAHRLRRSRSFPVMLAAFQPRWVFEAINDGTSLGRKMKTLIRSRLADYDEIPAHPALKWYGQTDNYEWQQYFLRDDDSALSRCPFLSGRLGRGEEAGAPASTAAGSSAPDLPAPASGAAEQSASGLDRPSAPTGPIAKVSSFLPDAPDAEK